MMRWEAFAHGGLCRGCWEGQGRAGQEGQGSGWYMTDSGGKRGAEGAEEPLQGMPFLHQW